MIMKLIKPLFSNKLTSVLLIAFAVTMAYATFLENDFGTQAVLSLVYKSWWFELIMVMLGINFLGNIKRYKLYRKGKLPILTFHLAFVVILIGAAITRYVSFEGLMHIREGDASNEIVSQDRFLIIGVEKDGEKIDSMRVKMNLSVFKQPDFSTIIGDNIHIKTQAFVPQAEQQVIESATGTTVLKVVTTNGQGRQNLFVASGGSVLVNNYPLTFDNPSNTAINIYSRGDEFYISSPLALDYTVMATQQSGMLYADSLMPLQTRALYKGQGTAFVIPEIYQKSAVVYRQSKDQKMARSMSDLLFVKISNGTREQEILLSAVDGNFSQTQHVNAGGYHLDFNYGPQPVKIPFSIELRDFQLESYPGSSSPSSYASEINVIDGDESFPYRVYMNNVLDYKGYRFFQASYDQDQLGTVLSVNQDFWGTNITYLGYSLMGLGMILTLFGKQSRFRMINARLNELKTKGAASLLVMFFLGYSAMAQDDHNHANSTFDYNKSLLTSVIDADHAAEFGKLLIQDHDGRIKPVNTLSSQFLRKIYGKSKFEIKDGDYAVKLNADQLFLMLRVNPMIWQQVPIIKIDKNKGAELLSQIGKEGKSYLTFLDLIDKKGDYMLIDLIDESNRKTPSQRNNFDKEVIAVDERFNVFFQGLTGSYLKIFPKKGDPENTWYTDHFEAGVFTGEDSIFIPKMLPMYYQSIVDAYTSKDWKQPAEMLALIRTYQERQGAAVIPSASVQKAELLYNKLKLFNHLFGFLWLTGIVLLALAIVQVFYPTTQWVNGAHSVFSLLVFLAFLALTFNLALRAYAAGYPPWSNGYEMIILVAWGLLFFGFVFYRKSSFVVPLAALFAGTLLFVAFLDWLNPEITNLVPVLKSYWLKIHVAIIVSSYAPLGLCALLGLLTLIFIIIDKGNNPRLNKSIKEMTYINELSMTIGLFLLAIGTFLGGVWANESWGRYWGWDPKETWALISVIVYAVVIHLRLIPKLNDLFVFNVASVVAFFSIIMTSFGVNYYLSGLHSYAKGDPVPIPSFIYWIVGIVFAIIFAAYIAKQRSETNSLSEH